MKSFGSDSPEGTRGWHGARSGLPGQSGCGGVEVQNGRESVIAEVKCLAVEEGKEEEGGGSLGLKSGTSSKRATRLISNVAQTNRKGLRIAIVVDPVP